MVQLLTEFVRSLRAVRTANTYQGKIRHLRCGTCSGCRRPPPFVSSWLFFNHLTSCRMLPSWQSLRLVRLIGKLCASNHVRKTPTAESGSPVLGQGGYSADACHRDKGHCCGSYSSKRVPSGLYQSDFD